MRVKRSSHSIDPAQPCDLGANWFIIIMACKGVGAGSCVEWITLPFRRRGQAVHACSRPSVRPDGVLVVEKTKHKKKRRKKKKTKSAAAAAAANTVGTSGDACSISPQHNKLVTVETKRKMVVVVQDDGEFIEGLFGACSNSSSAGGNGVPAKTLAAGCSRIEDTAKAKADPGGDRTNKGAVLEKLRRSGSYGRQER